MIPANENEVITDSAVITGPSAWEPYRTHRQIQTHLIRERKLQSGKRGAALRARTFYPFSSELYEQERLGWKREALRDHCSKLTILICLSTQGPKETDMKQGDFVKILGRDGFYLFLKEVQGEATVREGSVKRSGAPTFTIPMGRVVSLEKTE
jgi:hypothetical protein